MDVPALALRAIALCFAALRQKPTFRTSTPSSPHDQPQRTRHAPQSDAFKLHSKGYVRRCFFTE